MTSKHRCLSGKRVASILLSIAFLLVTVSLFMHFLSNLPGTVPIRQDQTNYTASFQPKQERPQSADFTVPLIQHRPQFVYLIQGHSVHDIPELKAGKNREIIWLTYSDKSGDIYFPKSTFTQGRNRLLQEAVARVSKRNDEGYLYYIFLDDDMQIAPGKDRTLWWRDDLPDNPFDRFELFLLDFEPAVGFLQWGYGFLPAELKDPVSLAYNFDACFNGLHRHTLSFMLPYVEDLDHISWWFHQWYVIHISAMFYNSYRIACNAIVPSNTRSHRNSKTKGDYRDNGNFEIPKNYTLSWMAKNSTVKTIKSGNISLLRSFETPSIHEHIEGNATKKGRMEYRVSTEFIKKTFNTSHPVIQRILRWRAQPTVRRILYGKEKEEPEFIPDIFPL